ncbi:hypothetical protein [Lyngbya aestuarii]
MFEDIFSGNMLIEVNTPPKSEHRQCSENLDAIQCSENLDAIASD